MLTVCSQNKRLFRYVLADSWFCSNDNMMFICHDFSWIFTETELSYYLIVVYKLSLYSIL